MRGAVSLLAVPALGAALAACDGRDDADGDGERAPGSAGAASASAQAAPPQSVAGAGSPLDDPVGRMPGLLPPPPDIENPYAGDEAALREGRLLFVAYNCYGCHGGHGGGGMGPSLRDDTWIYGERSIDIFDSIAEGRPNSMPAWQASLPAEIIWKMTAYIESMRTEHEPDPPPPNRSLSGESDSGSGSEGAPSEPV